MLQQHLRAIDTQQAKTFSSRHAEGDLIDGAKRFTVKLRHLIQDKHIRAHQLMMRCPLNAFDFCCHVVVFARMAIGNGNGVGNQRRQSVARCIGANGVLETHGTGGAATGRSTAWTNEKSHSGKDTVVDTEQKGKEKDWLNNHEDKETTNSRTFPSQIVRCEINTIRRARIFEQKSDRSEHLISTDCLPLQHGFGVKAHKGNNGAHRSFRTAFL